MSWQQEQDTSYSAYGNYSDSMYTANPKPGDSSSYDLFDPVASTAPNTSTTTTSGYSDSSAYGASQQGPYGYYDPNAYQPQASQQHHRRTPVRYGTMDEILILAIKIYVHLQKY